MKIGGCEAVLRMHLVKLVVKRVVQAVIQLIKDDDEFIRRSAIEIINATKDESTFDALVQSLR